MLIISNPLCIPIPVVVLNDVWRFYDNASCKQQQSCQISGTRKVLITLQSIPCDFAQTTPLLNPVIDMGFLKATTKTGAKDKKEKILTLRRISTAASCDDLKNLIK